MGESLENRTVQFGYQVDHLWDDCNLMDEALDLVRSGLPAQPIGLSLISEDVVRAMGNRQNVAG